MRLESIPALLLVLPFGSCAFAPDAGEIVGSQLPQQPTVDHRIILAAPQDVFACDVVHKTCALYVAVRSVAWDHPPAFGNDVDDSMVRWNMCTGGTMVACAPAPTAHGDTVRVGIPWPYHKVPRL